MGSLIALPQPPLPTLELLFDIALNPSPHSLQPRMIRLPALVALVSKRRTLELEFYCATGRHQGAVHRFVSQHVTSLRSTTLCVDFPDRLLDHCFQIPG
jgi:hypothetical protein